MLPCVAVRCGVLQSRVKVENCSKPRSAYALCCLAVCCDVLQHAAVCCDVLQHAAVCCSMMHCAAVCGAKSYKNFNLRQSASHRRCVAVQCVAMCCGVVQCVAMCCSVVQCVAMCCSVVQCVAEGSCVLQYVAESYKNGVIHVCDMTHSYV